MNQSEEIKKFVNENLLASVSMLIDKLSSVESLHYETWEQGMMGWDEYELEPNQFIIDDVSTVGNGLSLSDSLSKYEIKRPIHDNKLEEDYSVSDPIIKITQGEETGSDEYEDTIYKWDVTVVESDDTTTIKSPDDCGSIAEALMEEGLIPKDATVLDGLDLGFPSKYSDKVSFSENRGEPLEHWVVSGYLARLRDRDWET